MTFFEITFIPFFSLFLQAKASEQILDAIYNKSVENQ
jgi:hypothetical protein